MLWAVPPRGTKRDARRLEAALLREVAERPVAETAGTVTFACNQVIEHLEKIGRSPTTIDSYLRGRQLAVDTVQRYCHCDAMSMTKEGRLQIRVDPAEKQLLERAADALHVSVSAFVLQSSAAEAASVLAERSLIPLDAASAAAFTEALERPATVNQRLATALGRPRRFTWLD